MRLITTNYIEDVNNVEMANCRVYQTTCEDAHFANIIFENADILEGEFVNTNLLFVLMDNVNIENTENYYSSISFRTRRRGANLIYQVCVVTKEASNSIDLLKDFLFNVFSNLSLDNRIRIAFSSDPLETTYSIRYNEQINLCIDNMLTIFGLQNNEQPNQ